MLSKKFKNLDSTIKDTVNKVVDFNIVFSSILGIIIYTATFPKINSDELKLQLVINGFLVVTITLIAIFKKRIQTALKANIILIILFLVTYLDLALYGLLSANKVFFIAIPLFAIIVYDVKKATWIFVLSNLIFSGIALSIIFELNPFLQDVGSQSINPLDWLINYLELLIIATGAFVLFHHYGESVITAYNSLHKHSDELEIIVEDRTKELNQTNEELKKEISTKDRFFSIIGHDMKAPMQQLIQLVDLLKLEYRNKLETDDEVSKVFDEISDSSYRGIKLLENLLEWAMSQTGDLEFRPEQIIVNRCLGNIIEILSKTALEKGIKIKNMVSDDLVITCDRNMLNTILRNLISNGIKFTHPGGEVAIEVNKKDEKVIFTVRDTGVGMEEATINKLFKIEEKTSIKGTQDEKGTGLGLLLCKDFVERHGGNIWVESQLGLGSNFHFSIPN